ncbi:MAG: alpha/beta fold hydrolase [Bryobacteraceae bacterium]
MPYVLNQGAKIYWEQHGSGPPILLIMGLSFTHEMWFRIVPELKREYRVILFDNRGMGRSDVPRGPYRMRLMARDACAVLDAAGVDAAHVVGASMGGMIAQEIAYRYPKRVLSLVLACTSYSGLFARWPDLSCIPFGLPWPEGGRLERERSLRRLIYAPETPRERMEEDLRVRCGCRWTAKGFFNQLGGILLWNSYRWLPRIRVPALVVHGDRDRLIPPQNGEAIARRIPGARYRSIRGAGHILITDQPESSWEAIISFLREQAAEKAI